ncbi:MAG TPA: hypothetical protein DCE42_02150 [Myxococcales bacterium]|nr:hypothetical protein [Deltaproteobacteria bacterium]HAA53526.1 hypothetical protein [Myxococcales bacterium]|tara:strand:- start:219 stop:2243 length:2025 start_codon:yes stop_codon:yes gene_type:complete
MASYGTARPTNLGGYQLQRTVTEDRLGVLYYGTSPQHAQPVWVKQFHTAFTQDAALQQRFLDGIQYLRQFQHPSILRVLDFGNDAQHGPFAVTESCDGHSFQQLLSERQPLSSYTIQAFIEQLLDGIEYLHRSSLIHGDLHLGSIYQDAQQNVKVLHLGHGWWWSDSLRESGGVTQHSEYYLAPEQSKGYAWDHRVDIYACGVILAELLMGTSLSLKPRAELFTKEQSLRVSTLISSMSQSGLDLAQIEGVLRKALALNPNDRFHSAESFKLALQGAFTPSRPAQAAPQSFNEEVKTASRKEFSNEDYDEMLGDTGFADDSTVIQTMPKLDDEVEELSTVRMSVDEAMQNIDYQEYLRSNAQATQASQVDLAALESEMLGMDEDLTRPGIAPPDSLPALTPMPTIRASGKELRESMPNDPLEVTYVGPRDVARAAGGNEEATPMGWLKWAALPVGVLILGVIVIYVIRPTTPLRAPAPPPRKVHVTMELNTVPGGADIWVNGEKTGKTTPETIRSRVGNKLVIQLRKTDHKPITFSWLAKAHSKREFTLESTKPKVIPDTNTQPDAPQPRAIAKVGKKTNKKPRKVRTAGTSPLPRISGNMAILSLKSVPPKAKVIVGGRQWPGRTPLRIRVTRGVNVKIVIQKYGYHHAFFHWNADKNESKSIQLYRYSWYNP